MYSKLPIDYQFWFRVLVLLPLVTLSACRMPVIVNGNGFVFAQEAQEIYKSGYVFEINEDFNENFWPVPAPGNYFKGWDRICKGEGNIPCSLTLEEDLWSNDDEVPLEASFGKNYQGPLTLINYDLYWLEADRTLSIPASTVIIEGMKPGGSPRLFLAPSNKRLILPGKLTSGEYVFKLPISSPYEPGELWLFASATDSEGTVATVGYDFGLSEYLSADKLQPYKTESPWAPVLVDCATADDPFNLCSMNTLPYLGSLSQSPAVSDIMDRTVVSHTWMGKRFAQVLREMPKDLLKMFRGVTAVVISSDIRPAFFTAVTGAIYLDPQDLWLTPPERESIDWTPDYRSEFGSALSIMSISDYLDGNEFAWGLSSDYPEGAFRTVADIERPLAWLLSHELSHANDAVPPASLPPASGPENALDIFTARESESPSTTLGNTYPLSSSLLHRLGGVLFHGDIPSVDIVALSAAEAGLEFEQDSANAMYAYSTQREDTASLVEEVLMRHFYGVDKMEAFVDIPGSDEPACDDFTLRWGSINRASTPRIKERARLVLSSILDEADVSHYLDSVPESTQLETNIGLCSSLDSLSPPGGNTPGMFQQAPGLRLRALERTQSHIKKHRQVMHPLSRDRDLP